MLSVFDWLDSNLLVSCPGIYYIPPLGLGHVPSTTVRRWGQPHWNHTKTGTIPRLEINVPGELRNTLKSIENA